MKIQSRLKKKKLQFIMNEKLYELCLQNMLRFFKKSEEIMKFALPFQMETAYLSSEKKKTDHNHSYD